MMKVAMIMTSKFQYSGITMVIMNYYREIVKKKSIAIDFIIPNEPPIELRQEIEKENSSIYVIPMSLRRKNPLKYKKRLSEILKQNRYDIVHVHGSSSIMAIELYIAKKANIKVRIAHSHNTKSEHLLLHMILYPIFQKNYTQAVACGEKAGKWLFHNKKFHLLPNAQNIENYTFHSDLRKKIRKKYDLDNDVVLGHVGTFNHAKNHEFLIEILKRLNIKNNNYKLVLIGDGELFQPIKEKVKDYKLTEKVLFVGKSTKVNEWLNALDIMLLPSKYEGFPNVVLEWQISGLPCIVSDKVSQEVQITDLIRFETIDEKNSVEKWVDDIENTEIRSRDGVKTNIENIVKKGYDIKSAADNLIHLYNKLLEDAKNE